MTDKARLSTRPELEEDENDAFDNEEDFSFFDFAEGTNERSELQAKLALTHTPEQIRKIFEAIDELISNTTEMFSDSSNAQVEQ